MNGIVRGVTDMQCGVTEHIDTQLSGGLTICPRVVSVDANKKTTKIPVHICNLSAHGVEIPA